MNFGSMFGSAMGGFLDLGMDIWKQDRAESMQDHAQNFSSGEAAEQRRWAERMSGSAYQRATADMQAAGLNPMLAYQHGGAQTPSGASASGTAGSTPALTSKPSASFQTAAQIRHIDADVGRIEAEEDRTRAEAEEIRQRTPTHGVNIQRMQQDITESIERIADIQQRVKTGAATAAQLEQQVRNLQDQIPQIRAMTNQLGTLAALNEAQAVERLTAAGVNRAQAAEIWQKVKENLPQLERALSELELQHKHLATPGHRSQASVEESFTGILGRYLRALLPLGGVMGAIPLGRLSPKATPPAGSQRPKPLIGNVP